MARDAHGPEDKVRSIMCQGARTQGADQLHTRLHTRVMLLCDFRERKGFPVPGGTRAHGHNWPKTLKCPAVSSELCKTLTDVDT